MTSNEHSSSDHQFDHKIDELIRRHKQIKQLQEQQDQLKNELIQQMDGNVERPNGSVVLMEAKPVRRFNRDQLKKVLKEEGLSQNKVTEIMKKAKKVQYRSAHLQVHLRAKKGKS